ncbi:hypothetical protein GE09DRAFT_252089 [Coniochaeta sp. 2T2.1]|nr:hypothetical protein GE09DRAFT_252089 [Coniochaeta sp. 2T2.1]
MIPLSLSVTLCLMFTSYTVFITSPWNHSVQVPRLMHIMALFFDHSNNKDSVSRSTMRQRNTLHWCSILPILIITCFSFGIDHLFLSPRHHCPAHPLTGQELCFPNTKTAHNSTYRALPSNMSLNNMPAGLIAEIFWQLASNIHDVGNFNGPRVTTTTMAQLSRMATASKHVNECFQDSQFSIFRRLVLLALATSIKRASRPEDPSLMPGLMAKYDPYPPNNNVDIYQ